MKTAAYQLMDSAREYGADPAGWRTVLAEHLACETGAIVALSAEIFRIHDPGRAEVRLFIHTGWPDTNAERHFARYQTEGANARDPFRTALDACPSETIVASVSRTVGLKAYRASEVHARYMEAAGVGDMLTCITTIGEPHDELFSLFTCIRAAEEGPFSDEAHALALALAPLLRDEVGTRLADHRDPVAALTPRRRATLELLLSGLSEAEASAALGVSPHTLHSHVRDLYAAFGVGSRAELQAHFYGRGRLLSTPVVKFDPRQNRIRRSGADMARPWGPSN